jgi:eukaryotic-like serine/threonine-protein kinase
MDGWNHPEGSLTAGKSTMSATKPNEQSIFIAALELGSAEERAAYMRGACGEDRPLREAIDSLLAAHEREGNVLDSSPIARNANSETTSEQMGLSAGPGTVIGSYKLLQQIGEGGMGTVFMAQQTEPVKRIVAVKIIKAGMDSRQVIARFEAERQALALMDHPNIAKVLDAGTTGEPGRVSAGEPGRVSAGSARGADATPLAMGRPYFVMELVKGEPLTRYCDEHHLTPRQRLELFVPVCQAVQHAHQKGVIHRDLKPSNILVALYDGRPVPKVIDFGVAKASGQQLTDHTLVTGFGSIIGTLEYMSPEQAEVNQLDIDTRSDIYSLGVVLYELLTGSTPLDRKRLKQAAFTEMLRIIREEEPPKPSTRLSASTETLVTISAQRDTEPARLTKLLRGELDWIVMKALEKDRNRRYETANGFAADVGRYLNDEPVLAYPPSAFYRFRKFARRNKAGLATSSLLAAALIAVMTALAIGNVRITREQGRTKAAYEAEAEQRRRAQDNFGKTLGVIRTMVAEITKELPPTEPGRRKLVENVRSLCQDLVKEESSDESARQGRGSAYLMIGQIDEILGNPVAAEEAYRQAMDIFGRLMADFPDGPSYRHDLARTHSLFGLFLRSISARPQEAEEHNRRAIDLQDGLAREYPASPDYQTDLARTYHELGYLLWSRGRFAEAEAAYRQALAVQQPLATRFGPSASEYATDLANTLNSLGILLRVSQRLNEAELVFQQALDTLNKLPPDLRAASHSRHQLARSLGQLGILLGQIGRFAEAEQVLRQSARIREQAAADVHHAPEACQEVALCYRQLGRLLAAAGQPREAEMAFGQALVLMGKVLDERPALAKYRLHQAMTQSDLGNLYVSIGEHQKAKPLFHQALAGFRLACEGNPDDPDSSNHTARFLATCPDVLLRDPAQAVALATKAVEQAPQDGAYWNTLGIAQYRAGDWKAAAQALEKATALRSGGNGFDWFFLAMAHWQLGDKEQAHKQYDQTVEWMQTNQPKNEELLRFRGEAAELLMIANKAKPK